ncbi:MAG: hypothetical protein HOE45_05610 [Gammaproteobacteria bacterium]|jgi:hypothetical protein|nr:hypothetical protein [Gammaproteobacteria bacterium]MBT4146345.1 hypothetical protein [Gammaproteobacteria bacterium]MBT5222441.1 hypothetical protein [Gammaproteobacteria bacterium]MBT5825177.1 hypothetical protein [Gammaproteobacteria bacterium]MBT5967094.1 hypothetical protein [Gammaproteobacteria bacterium]
MNTQPFIFNQIHIEAARNASDDFNLFHDKHKWLQIMHNPFKGPIVLGFQLNAMIEYQLYLYRTAHYENRIISENGLRFSNYQITFVNAVRPDRELYLDIKKTIIKTIPELTLSNRITIKSNNKTVLLGSKKETQRPLFLADTDLSSLPDLNSLPNCSTVPGSHYFLKRKYINNGNAKNFLSGSLAEQSDYFDEIDGLAEYPEIFPCSLTSGALLNKAQVEDRHDFKRNPMVYTSHCISVNREYLRLLKNNDKLHILVNQLPESTSRTLNNTGIMLRVYDCFGLLEDAKILFRARLCLVPLEELLNNLGTRNK